MQLCIGGWAQDWEKWHPGKPAAVVREAWWRSRYLFERDRPYETGAPRFMG